MGISNNNGTGVYKAVIGLLVTLLLAVSGWAFNALEGEHDKLRVSIKEDRKRMNSYDRELSLIQQNIARILAILEEREKRDQRD